MRLTYRGGMRESCEASLGGLEVEDLGSTNGTYVNGQRIQRQPITFRDDVRLGSMVVQLSHPSISGLIVTVTRRAAKGEPMVVGSAPNSDIWIRDAGISPRHAVIKELPDGQYLLTDLQTPQGTYIDSPNFRITEATVNPGRTILLGSFVLPMSVMLRALGQQDASGLQRSEELDQALQQALSSGKGALLIGRDPACDLVVFHPTISGRHARLTRQADATVAIEDLGSTTAPTSTVSRYRAVLRKLAMSFRSAPLPSRSVKRAASKRPMPAFGSIWSRSGWS